MLHSSHCPALELLYKQHCRNTLCVCDRIADVNPPTAPQVMLGQTFLCSGTYQTDFGMLLGKVPHLDFSRLMLGHRKEFLQPYFLIVLFAKETALIHHHHHRL